MERIEMNHLNLPSPHSDENGDGNSNTLYGSTMTLGASSPGVGASTANLLKIDLEKKIDRHTGEERETWDNRVQFILSLAGFAVGLGNVWRFPYLTQKNGGGAFLIPYAVMLFVEGIPIFYLELAIGQRLRKGAIGCWNQMSPYLGGLGIAAAVVSFNVALYYNTIMAWCMYYLVESFQSPLPWSSCPSETVGNITTFNKECEKSGSTTYFWFRVALNSAPSIDSTPVISWKISAALICSWLLVFCCMIKGIKSSGKVVYVTATFPYFVLVIFFFRGVTLHGFEEGVKYLFIPKWDKLFEPAVWLDAATQIFYSFGLAFGCLVALASYNPVRSNFLSEALMVSVGDFFTSLLTATVVFSVLGFKATMQYEKCLEKFGGTNQTKNHNSTIARECDFEKLMTESASGTGLAFIAFTEAIDQFPVAPLWAVLFFLMLLTLGLDTMFGTLEGAITSINDMLLFPAIRKEVVCGVVCFVSMLISFCFATSTGPYVFDLFDMYVANIPLLVIAFIEVIAISYVYGLKQFSDDVEMMIGVRPSYFWMFIWRYLAPIVMIIIFVASLFEILENGSYYTAWDAEKGQSVKLPRPWWVQVIAAFLILSSVAWIPFVALTRYFNLVKWEPETPAFFPAEELREERNIKPHQTTFVEKYFFGFKD
ncbi:sodium- and chloride-dependent transporter XTRP3-like [Argonauta hians]